MKSFNSSPSISQRLHYKFDNIMSKGTGALIVWLGILSFFLILFAAVIIFIAGLTQEDSGQLNFIEATWMSLMRTLDPGTMGGDTGWGFRIVMLGVTVGGIFIVSTLIGVLTSGIENKLTELRKGRSFVVEKDHTLILGWSSKIFPIISELIIANENQKNPRIVILADQDKVEIDDEIKERISDTKNTKIITRSGNPIDPRELEIVNLNQAKSIIILAPETEQPDINVIKTLLAITNNPNRKKEHYHIVAEISEPKNLKVGEMISPSEATLILSDDLISRLIAQTCRQSGLSIVYTELLDFDGDEIYFENVPELVGKTFKEALHCFEDSTLMGISYKDGSIKLNPSMNEVFALGDKIVAISQDDDTIRVSENRNLINKEAIQIEESKEIKIEKTLILGWNKRGIQIIKELDNYVAKGSEINIVADIHDADIETEKLKSYLQNQKLIFQYGNITDRETLDKLNLSKFDHIIILCYCDVCNEQEADAKTLITLLHIRDIAEKGKFDVSIVSEMMDIKNRELAEVTKVNDFIVSGKLISLMLSQLSENKELKTVFDDLFDADGSEIYLKPAENYVKPNIEVNFYSIIEAAAQKGQVAIGYKKQKYSYDSDKAYGVVVNPKKSEKIIFEKSDKIIVLAED